ncbi:hypothetical protein PROFUN_16513 [Planoprotostelium fungivorum]|uniref:Uncharacterized protein n=1 Tax=Planoprotostelium fungivorum TaxID=1890364 RepID=A0A2P6MQC0_9EUKA|nr:hypothetical protein PROFUN_16513 [Planoprotostelium fungivorum]
MRFNEKNFIGHRVFEWPFSKKSPDFRQFDIYLKNETAPTVNTSERDDRRLNSKELPKHFAFVVVDVQQTILCACVSQETAEQCA